MTLECVRYGEIMLERVIIAGFLFASSMIQNCFAEELSKEKHVFHKPAEFMRDLKNQKSPGKKIYVQFCQNCHAVQPMIPVSAPKFRVQADWQNRLEQGKAVFFTHVDEGLNNMPPRGGCFECSDEDLWQAINYMLPQGAKFGKALQSSK